MQNVTLCLCLYPPIMKYHHTQPLNVQSKMVILNGEGNICHPFLFRRQKPCLSLTDTHIHTRTRTHTEDAGFLK